MKRIPPMVVDGKVVDQNPPCGGSWIRDDDGGLTPADMQTAVAAGLAEVEAAPGAQPAAPTKKAKE